MRSSGKPATLGELLGKKTTGLTLKDLPELLGEKMPELPYNRIGKYRLSNALRLRFGPGYRNIPGIKSIIEEFDLNVSTENQVKRNLEARDGDAD